MAFTVGEYQDVFLEEADEQLQELNQNLLELEKNHDNTESINDIFRAAHSLKSSAAFVGLNDLSDLAHNMENLLQGIRDKTMKVTPEIIDILFQCFDFINSIIESVSAGEKPTQDLSGIMKKIEDISEKSKSGESSTEVDTVEEVKVEKKADIKSKYTQDEMKIITDNLNSGKLCSEIDIYIDPTAPMRWVKIQLIINNLEQNSDILKTVPSLDDLTDKWDEELFRLVLLTDQSADELKKACEIDLVNRVDIKNISLTKKNDKLALKFSEKETLIEELAEEESEQPEQDVDEIVSPESDIIEVDEKQKQILDDTKKDDKKASFIKSVKVSIDKLDQLLNNVGELVIANSGFFKLFEEIKGTDVDKTVVNEFKNRMDQMSRIAKDLQGGIMKTRMVPIGQVFSRFNRLVRDLTKEFNKNIKLEVRGEDTELDKKVIDAIGEPLMHLIRNSIDHGVETVEERRDLGKSEEALVILNAYQGGNQIIVEVSDDGKGLDIEKIKKKAIDKGFTTPEILANMDKEDICDLIFHPGFSTADVITDVSGRGVGMNVVKEIISDLSGNVRIETEPGMGTKFELKFPLTLAIIPAIMVKLSNEMYAIPLADVIETVKISYADITTIESREVVNLRGEILSLLRLNEFIGINSSLKEDDDKIPVVVVGFGNRKIGVVVDLLEGKQEIVIKSLEENYASIEGISGASILGDGNICLILDIASMINKVISDEEKMLRHRKTERLTMVDKVVDGSKLIIDDSEQKKQKEFISFDDASDSPEEKKEFISFDDASDGPEEKKEFISFDEEGSSPGFTEVVEEKEIDTADTSIEYSVPEEELKNDTTPEVMAESPAEEMIDQESISSVSDVEETGKVDDNKDIKEDILYEKEDVEEKAADEDPEMAQRVKDTLNDFRKELEENVKASMGDDMDDSIMKSLQIEDGDMEKINVVMNVGIANAAESLSKILDKEISISIPEVSIIPIKKIPETLGEIDTVYIGVHLSIIGDIKGAILISLSDESGFKLVDMLFGADSKTTTELDEDGESALKEVTNIIGSSVINTLADKVDLFVRPGVPTVIHDYIQSTLDSMLLQNEISDEFALYMDTLFFFQDDSILGKMLILTETESLKTMIEKLRNG